MNCFRAWAAARSAVCLFAGLAGADRAFADELYEYGEYLSSECTTCHQLGGKSEGIPSITGWPVDNFVTVLESYRDGQQENAAMRSVARGLSDEDIKALAVFFHKQGQ